MSSTQRKSALSAATEKGAKEKTLRLHITIKPRPRQILLGTAAWGLFRGMLGIVGGMQQGTFPFRAGCIWVFVCLPLWVVTLKIGGWLK